MNASRQLVTGVDFAPVPTTDIERAIDFYSNTLALEKSVDLPERNYAEFETGNLTLSVYDPRAMGLPYNPNANPIALNVDSVEDARGELEGRGVEFAGETLDTGVCHMAFFADPDGNAMMLHHRYAPRAPAA